MPSRTRQVNGSLTRQARRAYFLVVACLSLCSIFFVAMGMLFATLVAILPEWQRIQQAGRITWDWQLLECVLYSAGNILVPLVFFRWLFRLARHQSPDHSPVAWMPAPNRSAVLRSSTKSFRLMVLVPFAVWGMIFVGGGAWMLSLEWKVGDPLWPILVVVCPAAAVLAVSGMAVHAIIAWFNPPVQLRLDRDTLRPGDSAQLFWELRGRTDRVRRLRIDLEGREERHEGKDVSRRAFARMRLVDTTDASRIASESVNIDLPVDVMHSLRTPGHAITWSIGVRGEIPRHPDVFEEFPIPLLPPTVRLGPFSDASAEHSARDGDALRIATGRRRTFAPGDTIDGVVAWQFDSPPPAIELRLFWYTSEMARGGRDVQIVATQRFKSLQPQGRRAFEFKLPDGPCSCSGGLVSLIWALELVVLPFGETQRLDFVVSPTGRPITPPAVGAWTALG